MTGRRRLSAVRPPDVFADRMRESVREKIAERIRRKRADEAARQREIVDEWLGRITRSSS